MSQPEISLGRFIALATFASTPFRFVKLSSGKLAKCAAGQSGLGVIQDEPVANEAGNVMLVGVSKILAGGTIAQGDSLISDANGKAVVAAAGDPNVFGQALEAGSDGEYIDMFVSGRAGDSATGQIQAIVPAFATDVEGTPAIARVPFDCTVVSVKYAPVANITGAATNHRAVAVINKGADGNGTTSVAALAFDNGVNALDYDEKDITVSVTAADLLLTAGDILAWASTAPGTGLADPGGLVTITVTRR